MNNSDPFSLNRRSLFGAAGVGLLSGVGGAIAGPAGELEFDDTPDLKDPWMLDPKKDFVNFLRAQGDLSGRISPQWWRGAYLAVYGDRNPEMLFRMEGCEMKRIVDLGNDRFEFQYRIFTSIKDPVTNETLNGQKWLNPITGTQITIEPNTSSAERVVSLTDRGIVETRPGKNLEALIHSLWTAQGPYVMHNGYKDRPAKRPIPLKAFATTFIDRDAAADFTAPRLETRFNTTFVAPFQRWMEMPDKVGNAVWHSSGHKARDVDSLPKEYLEQMFKYRPELTEWIGKDGRA